MSGAVDGPTPEMAENPPAISVLMPAYNALPYLREAVESVLSQTFSNFEFLIVDDGSTDGSGGVLDEYAAADPRVRVIHRPNGGYTSALNLLVEHAQSEFVARMDADDVCRPGRLEKQLDYLRRHPDCAVVGSRYRAIDEDGDPLCLGTVPFTHERIVRAMLLEESGATFVCHSSVLVRTGSIRVAGGYRTETEPAEDRDLWLRVAEGSGRLRNLPDVLVDYRINIRGVSATRSAEQAARRDEIVRAARAKRGLSWPPPHPLSTSTRPECEAESHRQFVWLACQAGNYRTARKYVRRLEAGSFKRLLARLHVSLGPAGGLFRTSVRLRRRVLHYLGRPQGGEAS